MAAGGCPSIAGGQAGLHDGTRGFPAGVEAGGFTSPYPPVMPQDDRRRCARHHPSTLEGSPTVITSVFGRPFQGRFPLVLLSPGHSASQR